MTLPATLHCLHMRNQIEFLGSPNNGWMCSLLCVSYSMTRRWFQSYGREFMETCEYQYDFVFATVLRVYHGDSLFDA
jgi:ABC-type sulfate transport system substrate-binding protein